MNSETGIFVACTIEALADLEEYYLEFGFPGDEEIIQENVDNESE